MTWPELRKLLALIALAAVAWAGTAAFGSGSASDLPTAVAERGSVARRVLLSGIVWPKRRVTVLPKTSGRVMEVLVTRGDRVVAGQPIFRMDDESARTEVQRKEIALDRVRLRRTTDENIDLASLDRRQAELDLAQARRALQDTILRAPFAGVVVFAGVRVGDMLSPSAVGAGVVVADTSVYVVDVEGDEYECGRIQMGASASVQLMSSASPFISGRVIEPPVLKRLGSGLSSPVFGFTVELDTAPTDIMFGVSGQVEVDLERLDAAVVVPVNAVENRNGHDFVQVIENTVARERQVTVLLMDDHVAAVDGISEGTVVLLRNPLPDR